MHKRRAENMLLHGSFLCGLMKEQSVRNNTQQKEDERGQAMNIEEEILPRTWRACRMQDTIHSIYCTVRRSGGIATKIASTNKNRTEQRGCPFIVSLSFQLPLSIRFTRWMMFGKLKPCERVCNT